MNNSICTLFDNILIDIHKFKSLLYTFFCLKKLDICITRLKKCVVMNAIRSKKCVECWFIRWKKCNFVVGK